MSTANRSLVPTHPDELTRYALGINDILAKPFTQEGMLRTMQKHLPHLVAHLEGPKVNTADISYHGIRTPIDASPATGIAFPPVPATVPAITPMAAPAPINTGGMGHKFERTPIQSPVATANSWHSPGAVPNTSPGASPLETGAYVAVNNSGQLVMSQRPSFTSTAMGPPGSAVDDRPGKRPRLVGPAENFV